VSIAEAFIAAQNTYDGAVARTLLADDADIFDIQHVGSLSSDFLSIDEIDFDTSAQFEEATGVQFVDSVCSSNGEGSVSCTYEWENNWTRALGDDRYSSSFRLEIADGQIQQLSNTVPAVFDLPDRSHVYWQLADWMTANNAEDWAGMANENLIPFRTTETIDRWQTFSAEFVTSVTGIANVTIEGTIDIEVVEGERVVGSGSGSFVVTSGADFLGCTAGTIEETYRFQAQVDKVMTCTSGPSVGTFTISAGGGTAILNAGGSWDVGGATGDFVGLTGSGPYYGRDVVTDETAPNPIYVFETVDAYTDEIIGTIELG
jgi:hypothetical protein